MTYFKNGSFSQVTLLGVVEEVKSFTSKKDNQTYTSVSLTTSESYIKEGEQKKLVSSVHVYVKGDVSLKTGTVVLVQGEVGVSPVSFKTETKYPVEQIVVTNASVQKVADVADASFSGLNSFKVIGRLGREPKEISAGKGGCSFSAAVSIKDGDTIWVPVLFWGTRGTKLAGILNKGDLVLLSGRGALGVKKVGDEEKKVLSLYGTDVNILVRKPKEESQQESSEETPEQTTIQDDSTEIPF